MLETDALKEKLEMEIHRFARPPEELSSGDPYFEQLQTMLAIREELENIPLCDIQRDMLLAMENVLESAWLFRNTPVPDRCITVSRVWWAISPIKSVSRFWAIRSRTKKKVWLHPFVS